MNFTSFDYPEFSVTAIPSFSDNYIYIIREKEGGKIAVLDPGESEGVFQYLQEEKIAPQQIWLTHSHWDHVNGVSAILERYPDCKVWGPEEQKNSLPHVDSTLKEGDGVLLGKTRFSVLSTDGHLIGDISYFNDHVIFTGDSLFMAGCGRVFSGRPDLMCESLNTKIASLNERTAVFCGHEYTFGNLKFAMAVEPNNLEIAKAWEESKRRRKQKMPSLPSSIGLEKKINPFLRLDSPEVLQSLKRKFGEVPQESRERFILLRKWKDEF